MRMKFGSYLVLPLKFDAEDPRLKLPERECTPFRLNTADLNENVKRMLNEKGHQSIGSAYRIPKEQLEEALCAGASPSHFKVSNEGVGHSFELLDSYLYIFHTQVAFLCLAISFSAMETLHFICNPGFAQSTASFLWLDTQGGEHPFCLERALEQLCGRWGLRKFYDGSPMLPEIYAYILALTDQRFDTLDELQKITFNLHKMQNLDNPLEDDSEADLRYVFAAKNNLARNYRWGCCVASQTISYAVADPSMDLIREMETQGTDGLPIVMLALFARYTCLRFTDLIALPQTLNSRSIRTLKQQMLRFQAFGTVSPANLSRWNNVKQIYGYLLEVCDTTNAVQDISFKVDILNEQQQELQNRRSSRVLNLVTIFGAVGIVTSIQSIVQLLTNADQFMWTITLLTVAVMCLCFGLALRKK